MKTLTKPRHKNKFNNDGLKDPIIHPPRIASLLNVSRRTEVTLHREGKGPPCWLLGCRRVSTVGTVEQWIAERAHQATLDALNNFGKRPRRSNARRVA